jgi:two-component system chemotaxis sensor kinase CheA
VHTIKGTSGFLGLDPLTDLAHTAESLLMEIRDGRVKPTPARVNLIFRAIDVLGGVLDGTALALRGDVAMLPPGYRELLAALRKLEADGYPAEEESGSVASRTTEPPKRDVVVTSTPVAQAAPAEAMVRVRTERLDRLVDMVGELVIAQAMLSQDDTVRLPGHQGLSRKVTHAAKIVRELQDLSMAMRMVPLKGPFQKVARLARDLAQRNNKIVEFVSDGEDTEIDRNLVDVLADPLVHMVRNSLDHGLELPDERVRGGKPAQGTLRLSAHHAGGNVVVEIEDDGRGLNPERIVAKARERGLIDSGDTLSISEIQNLIFHPGFSTADAVTEVSGRGVGMDVVRRNVEAMRGRIDIDSTLGKGTKFTIKLPLTLAITDGMLVRVGDERYLVPTIHIRLSFRPERSQLTTVAGKGELVIMRGEPIPIVRLHRLFGVPTAVEDAANGLLMIVGDSRSSAAILVDDLLGQQQVVAKSLGDALGRIPGLAGGAILGDGRVGLILDVLELNTLLRRSATSNDASMRGAA